MNGYQYDYNEPVDITGIEVRRLRQMYDAKLIDAKTAESPPKSLIAPMPKTPSKDGVFLKHKGFGNFVIMNGRGDILSGLMKKDEADRELRKYK